MTKEQFIGNLMDILYFNGIEESERDQIEEDLRPILDTFVNKQLNLNELARYTSVATIAKGKAISSMVECLDGGYVEVSDVMRLHNSKENK